jgi:Flp pilus assembly protein TadB
MGPRLLRRRRDGLLEIRRARARDLVSGTDAIVLSCLLAGWLLFVVLLVMTLVFDPPFLALAVWVIASLAIEQHRKRRPARLAPRLALVHAAPPPDPAA